MGISDLRDLAVIEEVSPDAIADSVVAVDAYNWLYRYMTIVVRYTDDDVYTTEDGTEVPNLIGMVKGIPKFFEQSLLPVFVIDGAVLELKEEEMQLRRERRREAAEKASSLREQGLEREAARYEARSQELTDVIKRTTRELVDILGIPYVIAPAEAEAQAAHMAREGLVDYVGSEDYDSLLFGTPVTLRKLTSSDPIERMDLEATLDKHSITLEQLIDIAILCGTDYNDGIHGFGPKTSLKAIQEKGCLEAVLSDSDASIEDHNELREIFLNALVTSDIDFQRHVDPDIQAAKTYLATEWEIPLDSLERAFDRLQSSTPYSAQ